MTDLRPRFGNERRKSGLEFIDNNRENAAFKRVFDDTPKEAGEKEVKGANIHPQDPPPIP